MNDIWTQHPEKPGIYWERRGGKHRIVILSETQLPRPTWQESRDETTKVCEDPGTREALARLPETAWLVEYNGPLIPPP